jgi:signal transduction histidine kinase
MTPGRLITAYASRAASVRRRGFWDGWAGIVTTAFIIGIIVALTVGWVLLWVDRPQGPSIIMLTLGSIGFAAVIGALVILLVDFRRRARLHRAEAAFLTAVSHNLRTPLAGLQASIETLKHPGLDEPRRATLQDAALAEVSRLERLVDNVIESGRLHVGRRALRSESVDMAALIEEATRDRERTLKGPRLDLHARGALWTVGDPRSLGLMLDNLLDNALNHAADTPCVEIHAHRQGDWVLLQIIDQGPGFHPVDGEHLFGLYRPGDTARAGSGLGLGISRAIARGHGGEVYLRSSGPGAGACAEVWLPALGPEER